MAGPRPEHLLLWAAAAGTLACGSRTGLTVPACPDAGVERCNGRDDDCDGVADDGLACFFLDGERIAPLSAGLCGADWYSYGRPDAESANPTPDIRASGRVAVAVVYDADVCAGASVAVIADLPFDGSGGQLTAAWTVEPANAAALLVSDEPGECTGTPGGGACTWVWQPCCTDGVLVGSFDDACVTVTLGGAMGVTDLVVLDGVDGRVPRRFDEPFELCAQIRPAAP
ncbi:MAG: hypothetical protein ACFCGT_27190 [Sandaracinaceae bacterium]